MSSFVLILGECQDSFDFFPYTVIPNWPPYTSCNPPLSFWRPAFPYFFWTCFLICPGSMAFLLPRLRSNPQNCNFFYRKPYTGHDLDISSPFFQGGCFVLGSDFKFCSKLFERSKIGEKIGTMMWFFDMLNALVLGVSSGFKSGFGILATYSFFFGLRDFFFLNGGEETAAAAALDNILNKMKWWMRNRDINSLLGMRIDKNI